MLTVKEAEKLQKKRETTSIISFLAAFTVIGILTAIMFGYSKVLEMSSFYCIPPAVALGIAIKASEIYQFLSPRKFSGEVVHVHIYGIRERKRKGLNYGSGTNSSSQKNEAEIIVQSSDGKSKILTVKDQDTVKRLSMGDKVILYRFLDTPVITEDLGKERSY